MKNSKKSFEGIIALDEVYEDESYEKGGITLNDPSVDHLITTSQLEWEHIRSLMGRVLQDLDNSDEEHERYFRQRGINLIPGIGWCERAIRRRLINEGFDKKFLDDEKDLHKLVYAIDFEQWGGYPKHPPYGFPPGTYAVSDDNEQMLIRRDIEAALLALYAMKKLEKLVVNDCGVNREIIRACIYTFQIAFNAARAGMIPELSHTAKEYKKDQSEKASKERTKWGMPPKDRKKRNNCIFDEFKKSRLSLNAFAEHHAKNKSYEKGNGEYLSKSAIKKIITSHSK